MIAVGDVLKENIALVEQHDAREQAYRQLIRTIELSVDKRAALDQLFLTEDRTIDFLAELEQVAVTFGIEMKTTGLELKPADDTGFAELNVRVALKGSHTQTQQFLKLLETLPYHAAITGVNLRHTGDGDRWESDVQLQVTSLPHD